MSKLKTKKNRARILIAFGRGIAATLAIEAAMLFVHAGCEVKAALIDGGEEWLTDAAIKSVCRHSALCAAHKPGWSLYNDVFDMAIVVSPSLSTCHQLTTGLTSDFTAEFILKNSSLIRVLAAEDTVNGLFQTESRRLSLTILPKYPTMLSSFYQSFFASCISAITAYKKAAKKCFYLSYSAPKELEAITSGAPLPRQLKRALFGSGFIEASSLQKADAAIETYYGPSINENGCLCEYKPNFTSGVFAASNALKIVFVPPETDLISYSPPSGTVIAQSFENRLAFLDLTGNVRVIPNLTGKHAFLTFCSYITALLEKPKG